MAAEPKNALLMEPQIVLLETNQFKLSKSSVDYLIRTKSPRVELVPKQGKSDVWQRFSPIRVDGNEVDFCACNFCHGIVTFTKKSGTNGMRTHRCKTKREELSKSLSDGESSSSFIKRADAIAMPTNPSFRTPSDRNTWTVVDSRTDDKNLDFDCEELWDWQTSAISSLEPKKKQRKTSKVINDLNGFEVDIDCSDFKPNELSVKAVGNEIVIQGEHGERKDEIGYIKRHFTRRIKIPADVESEKLISSFWAGVLTVKAPKKRAIDAPKERIIPIITVNNNEKSLLQLTEKSDSETDNQTEETTSEEIMP